MSTSEAARMVGGLVAANVNGLIFVGGLGVLTYGIAGFSRPAADVVLGAVLMAVGAAPYVTRKGPRS